MGFTPKTFVSTNHLGNVLVTVSDKKIAVSANGTTIDYYNADVVTASDYYPFGMQMPGRKYSQPNSSYRYGFNGQENSDEIASGLTTAMYWEYDSRIGRRWNIDPVIKVNESPYLCFSGSPIMFSDPLGDDANSDGGKGKKKQKQAPTAKATPKVAPKAPLPSFELPDYLKRGNETNRGESTQIKKPINCPKCKSTPATPAITATVSKGAQVGIKVAGVGLDVNLGSREILKVTDVDPGTNQADKVSTKKGWGVGVGLVSASKEINSKTTIGKNKFGNTTETIESEVSQSLSIGIKKTPLSVGVERTWNVEQYSPFYNEVITGDSGLQPVLGVSTAPTISSKVKGTEFSISLYYKLDVKVDIKQVLINIFNDFNTGH